MADDDQRSAFKDRSALNTAHDAAFLQPSGAQALSAPQPPLQGPLALALGDAGLGTWLWDVRDDSGVASGVLTAPDSPPERWPAGTARAAMLAHVDPDDRPRVEAAMDAVLGGATDVYAAEFRIETPDGRLAHVASHGRVLLAPDGQPHAIVGVGADVTARRTAEAALADANAMLRGVLDAAPLAVITLDADERITLWNPAATALLGYTPEEVLDSPDPTLPDAAAGEELRAALARCGEESAMSGASGQAACGVTYDGVRRTRDGQVIEVAVSIGVLRDRAGARRGSVVTLADLRERRQLEAQLRQAQKMEAVGRLAGGVAHDFNNLLTVIRGGVDFLLAELPSDSQTAADARDVRTAAERATALTRQLLAFSRRQALAPRTLDLSDVVRAVEPMLRRLVGADIELVTVLEPTPLGVRADPGQLEQVVVNLVVNARDAMPNGGVLVVETCPRTLTAAAGSQLAAPVPAGEYAVLEVTDTGNGMTPAVLARVFEPFFTTKSVGNGTGLGLATVYGIVTQSGGGLSVQSSVGRGATFGVLLPQVVLDMAAGSVSRSECPVNAPPQVGTVLVVEDEAAVRTTVRRVLERRGHRVLEARHGGDALSLLRGPEGASVDLVLTDVTMPEMGGRALVGQLAVERPTLPVLVMSGYAEEARGTPMAEVIPKPFEADVLAMRIARALGEARARSRP